MRLALGYSAVIIAAATFALDYKFGWDKTKGLTLWAVVVYFVLNSALTYWIWAVEKGKIFTGERAGTLVCTRWLPTSTTNIFNLRRTDFNILASEKKHPNL